MSMNWECSLTKSVSIIIIISSLIVTSLYLFSRPSAIHHQRRDNQSNKGSYQVVEFDPYELSTWWDESTTPSILEQEIPLIVNHTTGKKHFSFNNCTPSNKIKTFVMTKIEKTGSSTLFGIFARFVRQNHLNILIQTKKWHIDWWSPKGVGWDIGPRHDKRADALINHARYNKRMFHRHIVPGYKYIVPVREPVSWIKSAVKFFSASGLIQRTTPEEVLQNDGLLYQRRSSLMEINSWFHLPQLQWLGFDYTLRDNLTAITEYIAYIAPKIDIPILNDQFDSSLIILRRRFCWQYSDIFYRSYAVTNSKQLSLSSKSINKLLSAEVNLGDKLLYEEMNKTWWNQPEVKDPEFWSEVAYFTTLNKEISTKRCPWVIHAGVPYTVPACRYHSPVLITYSLCNFLQMDKGTIIASTIEYALGSY